MVARALRARVCVLSDELTASAATDLCGDQSWKAFQESEHNVSVVRFRGTDEESEEQQAYVSPAPPVLAPAVSRAR